MPQNPDIYQLVQKVESVTSKLCQISEEQGFALKELTRIWVALPVEDSEGMTYLEIASQCILEVSSLVDTTYVELPRNQRTAKKFKLMSSLLNLKADQLV